MKATGIVRRIDDLGRIVIPKEIRRSLRIREGDPLELYTVEGGVVFKKYSPMGEWAAIFEKCSKTLTSLGIPNAWYDRDEAIAGSKRIFPINAPDEITRDPFEFDNVTFLPFWVDGDLYGYVAVSRVDAEERIDTIKAVMEVGRKLMEI